MKLPTLPRHSRRQFIKHSMFGISAAGLLLPAASLAQGKGAEVIAETQYGKVRGSREHGVSAFKGIPYGANTGGANRFKPAKDPAAWTGVRDALAYGPAAPQSPPGRPQQDGKESEDCLVLNVWSRGVGDDAKPLGEKRPVMFWCHGGGFSSLSGSSPLYDGTNLCLRGDVVVVTLNHRLNCMGFTHLAELGGEEYAESGNVGMLDIVHALKWVKNNIEAFGGDPDRVMIFGESGGGRKVATLLAMPDAKGLFHSAVIQSGATLQVHEPEEATKVAEKLLKQLGLNKNSLGKLRELPVGDIIAAYAAVSRTEEGQAFQPVHDGAVLPYHPFYPGASPVNPDVPVIVGANRTEMTYFAREADFALSAAEMKSRVENIVGKEHAEAVIAAYREANPDASPSEIYFLIFSDERYVMPSITIAERRAALNKAPVYLYYFTWDSPVEDGRRMSPHSLEIPFAFDNLAAHPMAGTADNAKALADKMSSTWIAFARTGDPNAGTLPRWLPFTAKERHTMVLDDTSKLVKDPIATQRTTLQPLLNL